jgi:hypothetical protein
MHSVRGIMAFLLAALVLANTAFAQTKSEKQPRQTCCCCFEVSGMEGIAGLGVRGAVYCDRPTNQTSTRNPRIPKFAILGKSRGRSDPLEVWLFKSSIPLSDTSSCSKE